MTSRLLVDKIEGKTTASTVQMPEGSVIQYKFQTSATARGRAFFGAATPVRARGNDFATGAATQILRET